MLKLSCEVFLEYSEALVEYHLRLRVLDNNIRIHYSIQNKNKEVLFEMTALLKFSVRGKIWRHTKVTRFLRRNYTEIEEVSSFCAIWKGENLFKIKGKPAGAEDAQIVCPKMGANRNFLSGTPMSDLLDDFLAYDGEFITKSLSSVASLQRLGDLNRLANDKEKAISFY